jgi:hypothetical protein
MNAPCSVTNGVLPTGLVMTGNRQDRSTLERGRSGEAVGAVLGLRVTVAEGDAEIAGAVGLGLELLAVVAFDWLHAKSTSPRIARSLLIAASNGRRGQPLPSRPAGVRARDQVALLNRLVGWLL